jgi:hypothetical protein
MTENERVLAAFEAGFRARPLSTEQWRAHELTGEPRQFDFSPSGSAEDILSEAWAAYLVQERKLPICPETGDDVDDCYCIDVCDYDARDADDEREQQALDERD